MFSDPISVLTALAPLPEHAFGYEVVREFDEGLLASMLTQGLLVEAPTATEVLCAGCDHSESVPWEPVEDATGSLTGIRSICATTGTEHEGPVEWIRRYRIDIAALARVVGTGLGSRQPVEEIESGISYRWPRVRVGGVTLPVVLALGLNGPRSVQRWKSLGLSPHAVVIGIGPTPVPPESLPPPQTGSIHFSIWDVADVDDHGHIHIDRERFEQDVDEHRSGQAKPRKPSPHEQRQINQITELITEVSTRLRDARRALLDGDGGRANGLCVCLRTDDAVAAIIGVNRSTIFRWRTKGVTGMDNLDALLLRARDDTRESLRSWNG